MYVIDMLLVEDMTTKWFLNREAELDIVKLCEMQSKLLVWHYFLHIHSTDERVGDSGGGGDGVSAK